jgi:hypothetical protein
MFSTVNTPAATVYPDSDKIAMHVGNPDDNTMARRSDALRYYDGEE